MTDPLSQPDQNYISTREALRYPTPVVRELLAAGDALRDRALLNCDLDHPTVKRWDRAKRVLADSPGMGGL